jgi:hypothetical protein
VVRNGNGVSTDLLGLLADDVGNAHPALP